MNLLQVKKQPTNNTINSWRWYFDLCIDNTQFLTMQIKVNHNHPNYEVFFFLIFFNREWWDLRSEGGVWTQDLWILEPQP